MSLTITDNLYFFSLNKQQSIDLELKLNVTSKGHELRPIGDVLYNFGSGLKDSSNLVVKSEEFNFLKMLLQKNHWRDCKNL